MSLNVFLVFCILGVAFMMYALFQWTCGTSVAHMAGNCPPTMTPS